MFGSAPLLLVTLFVINFDYILLMQFHYIPSIANKGSRADAYEEDARC